MEGHPCLELDRSLSRYIAQSAFAAEARAAAALALLLHEESDSVPPPTPPPPAWFAARNAPFIRTSGVKPRRVAGVLFDVARCPAEMARLRDETRGVRDLRVALVRRAPDAARRRVLAFPHVALLRSGGALLLAMPAVDDELVASEAAWPSSLSCSADDDGDESCEATEAWQLPSCAADVVPRRERGGARTTLGDVAARLRGASAASRRALTLCSALKNVAPRLLDAGAALPGVALLVPLGGEEAEARAVVCAGGVGLCPTAPAQRTLSALLVPLSEAAPIAPLLLDAASRSAKRAKQLCALLGGGFETRRCAQHGNGLVVYIAADAGARCVNRRASLLSGVEVRGVAVLLQRSTARSLGARRCAAWPAALSALPVRLSKAPRSGGGDGARLAAEAPLSLDADASHDALPRLLLRSITDPACFDEELKRCAGSDLECGLSSALSALRGAEGAAVAHLIQLRRLLDAHGVAPRALARLLVGLASDDDAAARIPKLFVTATSLRRVLARRQREFAVAVAVEEGAAPSSCIAAAFINDCIGQPRANQRCRDLWCTELAAELILGPVGAFDQQAVLQACGIAAAEVRSRVPCPHELIGPLLSECHLRLRPAACRALQAQFVRLPEQRSWTVAADGSDFEEAFAAPHVVNSDVEVDVLEATLKESLLSAAVEGDAEESATADRYARLVQRVFGGGEVDAAATGESSSSVPTDALSDPDPAASRMQIFALLSSSNAGAQAAARVAERCPFLPLELVHALASDGLRNEARDRKHLPTLHRRVALIAFVLRTTLQAGTAASVRYEDASSRLLCAIYLCELRALASKLKRKMPSRLIVLATVAEEQGNRRSTDAAWRSSAELLDAFDAARSAALAAGPSGRIAPRAALETIRAILNDDDGDDASVPREEEDRNSRELEQLWSGRVVGGEGEGSGVVVWGLPAGLDGEVEMVLKWEEEKPMEPWRAPIAASARGVVLHVSCGYRHTAMITRAGELLTFGHGVCGRLGHGDEVDRHAPTAVAALSLQRIVEASCGREHTAAVAADGSLYSWGWGEAGRLGHGNEDPQSLPTAVAYFGKDSVADDVGVPTHVACGREHTLVCTSTGALFTFGAGSSYRLGTGDQDDRYIPTRIVVESLGDELVCGLAGGEAHSAAVTRSGAVFTWGFGRSGALGHGCDEHERKPCRVDLAAHIVEVACGAYHTAFLSECGKLWSCGDGSSGQFGYAPRVVDAASSAGAGPAEIDLALLSSTVPRRQHLVVDEREHSVTSIACGFWQTVAVTSSGRMYRWGACGGELALAAQFSAHGAAQSLAPQRLGDASEIFHHAGVGVWQTVACTSSTRTTKMKALPHRSRGEVLEAAADPSASHVTMLGVHCVASALAHVDSIVHLSALAPHGIVSVASGASHSLALSESGSVFAWGKGGAGQLGVAAAGAPSPQLWPHPHPVRQLEGTPAVRICAGGSMSAAVLLNGTVATWGDGGKLRIAPSLGDVYAVDAACGAARTIVALSEKGRVAVRGTNVRGRMAAVEIPALVESSDALSDSQVAPADPRFLVTDLDAGSKFRITLSADDVEKEKEGADAAAAKTKMTTEGTNEEARDAAGVDEAKQDEEETAEADGVVELAPQPPPRRFPNPLVSVVAGADGRVLGCTLHGGVREGTTLGAVANERVWTTLALGTLGVLGRIRALRVACGDAHAAIVTQVSGVCISFNLIYPTLPKPLTLITSPSCRRGASTRGARTRTESLDSATPSTGARRRWSACDQRRPRSASRAAPSTR